MPDLQQIFTVDAIQTGAVVVDETANMVVHITMAKMVVIAARIRPLKQAQTEKLMKFYSAFRLRTVKTECGGKSNISRKAHWRERSLLVPTD